MESPTARRQLRRLQVETDTLELKVVMAAWKALEETKWGPNESDYQAMRARLEMLLFKRCSQ